MSAQLTDGWNLIPVAVLGASILGSAHCVSMCGGLVTSLSRSSREIALYHLGRLLGYSVLGAIAGFFGRKFLGSEVEGVISWLAALGVGLSLILIGLKSWNGGGAHFFHLPNAVLSFLYQRAGGNALLAGALSAFLPCGWLQSFILAAVATRSFLNGAILLLFFWLGTLPALTVAPLIIQKFLAPLARKLPRVSAILLIAAGLFSIGLKASTTLTKQGGCPSCHHSAVSQSLPGTR